ncbi:hypothetical protein GCM10009733_086180 [Nonomuraea maheshkhaliensis]|uniref:Uncharacterized protein n=1 Tax=Nonomuraea maheshkhaliensis TaxID=419590 RepID=A0ABP4SNX1_9ACTN
MTRFAPSATGPPPVSVSTIATAAPPLRSSNGTPTASSTINATLDGKGDDGWTDDSGDGGGR